MLQEDEQAKAEEELDPAVQERRRLHQAEQWRLQQLQTGAASEDNANFQVCNAHSVPVYWRPKLGKDTLIGNWQRLAKLW